MQRWSMVVRLSGCDLVGAGVRRATTGVRRASWCWGTTSQCLDVRSPLAVSLSLLFSWGVIHLKVK